MRRTAWALNRHTVVGGSPRAPHTGRDPSRKIDTQRNREMVRPLMTNIEVVPHLGRPRHSHGVPADEDIVNADPVFLSRRLEGAGATTARMQYAVSPRDPEGPVSGKAEKVLSLMAGGGVIAHITNIRYRISPDTSVGIDQSDIHVARYEPGGQPRGLPPPLVDTSVL